MYNARKTPLRDMLFAALCVPANMLPCYGTWDGCARATTSACFFLPALHVAVVIWITALLSRESMNSAHRVRV